MVSPAQNVWARSCVASGVKLAWVGWSVLTVACSGASADAEPLVRVHDPAPVEAVEVQDAPLPRQAAPKAPAPERAPTVDPAPPPEPDRPRGHADLDPDNDSVVGPPDAPVDCQARLTDAGVSFKPARIGLSRKREDGVATCGAHEVVRFRSGPGEIEYSRSPLLTCGMAIALADFERIVQDEAERVLGTRVERIDHLGTYNCRKMVNYDLISEHSFANGIDLRRFHLQDGRTVTVLEHFSPKVADADAEPEALFLRGLSRRLYDEDIFSVVLTPAFDRLHRNHFHLDMARYRVDGTVPD